MYTTAVKKWGNSQGIRLSKEIMSKLDLQENDELLITVYDGKMLAEKITKPKFNGLKDRLETFYGKSIDEIQIEPTEEISTGIPRGGEIW